MMETTPRLNTIRARQARLAVRIGKTGFGVLFMLAVSLLLLGVLMFLALRADRLGYLCLALGLACLMPSVGYWSHLKDLPVSKPAQSVDDIMDAMLLGRLKLNQSPLSLWQTVSRQPGAIFMLNHINISPDSIAKGISDRPEDATLVWKKAVEFYEDGHAHSLHAGTLTAALILTSTSLPEALRSINIQPADINATLAWLERVLSYNRQPKPYYGGLARDWAKGYTNLLEQYGQDIRQAVEASGGGIHFQTRGDVIPGIVRALSQGAGGVTIVGEAGVGKTSLVYMLQKYLLQAHDNTELRYYRVIALKPSLILSDHKGNLEVIMLNLFSEAIRSGNVILFLDDAQLFFSDATGSFDATRLLLPILQARQLKIIAAMSPVDYQALKVRTPALAEALPLITLQEPPTEAVMDILEDTALGVEYRQRLTVTYEAIKEAYRLSGLYIQDEAYPGKAIRLLEQSTSYADRGIITPEVIQRTIEQSLGVKVSQAGKHEADVLLNLEAHLHERMINQERAVNAVAAALRRARAGVASSKRPIGSFLFLGPTGVGKTELARSLAAVYFGDERNMIRMDMSEYQQTSDINRILSVSESGSLISAVRRQPFSVVLFDEIEKAHPSILDLLLQLIDEGRLSDTAGKPASFRDAIIIVTSNVGAVEISERVVRGESLDSFEGVMINKLIAEAKFRPELLNRFDDIVLFRPLNIAELKQVAVLMVKSLNAELAKRDIAVELTDAALERMVRAGYDPKFGARPMRRVIQRGIEDIVAERVLQGKVQPGSRILLDAPDLRLPEQPTPEA